MIKVRIFVSSPGDVATERVCTERILDRLQLEYAGRVRIEGFFWEHEPMRATASFNDPQNIPLTAEFDVVVCILWSRLGTMLSRRFTRPNGEPYPSGTAFEIETAAEAYRLNHRPDLLVYRKTEEVPMPVNQPEEAKKRNEQLNALNAFIDEWFYEENSVFKAAINEYRALGQFEAKLERPLRKLIEHYLARAEASGATSYEEPEMEAPEVIFHGDNPFPGLNAFDYSDARVFFGRSQAIEDVLTVMKRQAAAGRAMTLVHGVSGCGKSSLIRAGIIPMLTGKYCVIEGVGCWCRADILPGATGDSLLQALAASLLAEHALPALRTLGMDTAPLAAQLASNPQAVVPFITAALQTAAQHVRDREGLADPPPTLLVLLVDQLEQIFSDDGRFPKEHRLAFAAALDALARSGKVWVIATIRSDQLARLTADLPGLAELTQGGQHQLLAPTENDMDLMIRLPAKAAGVEFEEDPVTHKRLESRLLAAAREAPDGLPLLSFVLRELFKGREHRGRRTLMTHARLDALGGLEGAVKTRAQEIYGQFLKEHPQPPGSRGGPAPLTRLARALVTVGLDKNGPVLRRVAPLSAFEGKGSLARLVSLLIEGRLLTQGPGAAGESTVYVTHEALLREWDELAEAIGQNRTFLALRARASTAAAEWQERKQARDFLWDRGARLADAKALLRDLEDLDPAETGFIRASVSSAKKRRLVRALLAAGGFGGLAVAGWLIVEHEGEKEAAAAAFVDRQKEKNDLEEQLAAAVMDLKKAAFPVPETTPAAGDDDEDYEYSEEYYYSQKGEGSPALSVLEISRRLLKLEPQHKEAFAARVLARIYDESTPSGEEDGEAALRTDFERWIMMGLPKDDLLHLNAQYQWRHGSKEQAVRDWAVYLEKGRVDDATRRALLDRTTSFFVQNHKWREAETTLNAWLKWDENAVARLRRAIVASRLLRLDQAQEDLAKARELSPDLWELSHEAPRIERMLRQRKELESVTAAIQLDNRQQHPELYLERAKVLMLAGAPESALPDLDTAAKILKGRSTAVAFVRGMALRRSGKEIPPESKVENILSFGLGDAQFEAFINEQWDHILKMLQADREILSGGDTAENRVKRSGLLRWMAQHKLALEDADAALRFKPGNGPALFWKGLNLVESKAYKEAMEIAVQALRNWPADTGFLRIKAEAHHGLGQHAEAVAVITVAMLIRPNAYFHELRARFLRSLGREKEAEEDDQAAYRLKRNGSN